MWYRIDLHYLDTLSIKIESKKKFPENGYRIIDDLNFYIESDFSDNLSKYLSAFLFTDHYVTKTLHINKGSYAI